MADAADRRVIMRTSVLPTARTSYAAVPGSLEEKNFTKAAYNKNIISSVGRLGGSSKMTDITNAQWGDGWTSMFAPYITWADLSDATDESNSDANDSPADSLTKKLEPLSNDTFTSLPLIHLINTKSLVANSDSLEVIVLGDT